MAWPSGGEEEVWPNPRGGRGPSSATTWPCWGKEGIAQPLGGRKGHGQPQSTHAGEGSMTWLHKRKGAAPTCHIGLGILAAGRAAVYIYILLYICHCSPATKLSDGYGAPQFRFKASPGCVRAVGRRLNTLVLEVSDTSPIKARDLAGNSNQICER